MPNITWQEPQIIVDILALNLFADKNKMTIPGPKDLTIISPWISDVELEMRPGSWYQQLTTGLRENYVSLYECINIFLETEWQVNIAVLAYGRSPSGLEKKADKFELERRLLKKAIDLNANVYLVPDLHAKGIITPFAIVTGSTNITHSGLYAQTQNVNYFPHDHPDYNDNLIQLMNSFRGIPPIQEII